MASILARIQNYDQVLTPSEMKVAEFLQLHPEESINCSIHEVARRSGVSVASVSRLALTLGYKDWKDLRHNLVRDVSGTEILALKAGTGGNADEELIRKIFDCSMVSLKDTFEQIDKQSVIRVVAAMEKTKRAAFFGTGRSGCFAKEESLRFAALDIYADAYSDEYQMVLQSSRMGKGDVAFGFSNSGRSRATVNALAAARENNALTVGIANYHGTPLEDVSDIYFCTSFPHLEDIGSSLTARIALLCVMDSIYVLAATRPSLASRIENVNRDIDKNLRISGRTRSRGK